VISVTERKQKPFEDVKADVKTAYVDAEKSKQLDDLAKKLVDKLNGGEAFAKVAEESGGKAELTESIKRTTSPPGLTTAAVKQAFSLAKGGAGFAETSDRASRIVFQVKDIFPASAASKEAGDRLKEELKSALGNELFLQYFEALKQDYPVHVNEAELARATGAGTGE
jgi:peptidyl-prolyl cis-trans isomerase D